MAATSSAEDDAVAAFAGLLQPGAPLEALKPADDAVTAQLGACADPREAQRAINAMDRALAAAGSAALQLRIQYPSAAAPLAAQMLFDASASFHAVYQCHFAMRFKARSHFCTAPEAAKIVKHLCAAHEVALARPRPGLDDAIYESKQGYLLQLVGQLCSVSACAAFASAFARCSLATYRAGPSRDTAMRAKFGLELSVLGVSATREMPSHPGASWSAAAGERWRACGETTWRELREYLEVYLHLRDEVGVDAAALVQRGPPPSEDGPDAPPLEERLGERAYRMLVACAHAFCGGASSCFEQLELLEEVAADGAGTEPATLRAAQQRRVLREASLLARATGASQDAEFLEARWGQASDPLYPGPSATELAERHAAREGNVTEATRAIVAAAREQGNAAVAEKKWDDAVRCYDHGIEESEAAGTAPPALLEAHAKLRANRSLAHLELGQHERALADGRAAVASAPQWVKARFRVSAALMALSRPTEAAAALEAATELPEAAAGRPVRRELDKALYI